MAEAIETHNTPPASPPAWDDAEFWHRAGLRRDGKPRTDRGRRRMATTAQLEAHDAVAQLLRAVGAAPTREDAAFILGMALAGIAERAPGNVAMCLRAAVSAAFDEAYPAAAPRQ